MTADEARKAGFKPTPELRWHARVGGLPRGTGSDYVKYVLEQLWETSDGQQWRQEWIEVPTWPPLTETNAKRASNY